MGDINRDLLNKQITQAWSDYMEPFGLVQMVSEAIRVELFLIISMQTKMLIL